MPWLLYTRERALDSHWTGGWVSCTASLHVEAKRKHPLHCPTGK